MLRWKSISAALAVLALVYAGALPSFADKRNNQDQHQHQNHANNPPRNNDRQAPRPNKQPNRPSYQPNRPNYQAVPRPPQSNSESGHHAGQWLRRYKDVPLDQQEKALNNDPDFRKLPSERQDRLRQRLQRFSNLPPDEKQRTLRRMETWEHLTPEQKTEARGLFSQMRGLPPERRSAMRNAINALRAMPPDARRRAIDSGRFSQFSPEEREMLKGASKLPLAPPEPETPQQ